MTEGNVHIAPQPYFSFIHKKNKDIPDITYYDPNIFEWKNEVEKNWMTMRDEVIAHMEDSTTVLKPYYATNMMNAPAKWKAFSFYFWGMRRSKKAIENCPKTLEILRKIPGITSASVSIMEPQSEIKPHYGDTDAVYRIHLPLVVSESLPACGFRVGYEDRSWEEGKLLVFNDAAYHKAWNLTDKRRVVLIFDVIRPPYAEKKIWICSRVFGFLSFQMFNRKIRIFKKEEGAFVRAICFFNALYFWCLLHFLKRKSAWL